MTDKIESKTIHEVFAHHMKPAQGETENRFANLNEIEVLMESAVPTATPIVVAKLEEHGIKISEQDAANILRAVLGVS